MKLKVKHRQLKQFRKRVFEQGFKCGLEISGDPHRVTTPRLGKHTRTI